MQPLGHSGLSGQLRGDVAFVGLREFVERVVAMEMQRDAMECQTAPEVVND